MTENLIQNFAFNDGFANWNTYTNGNVSFDIERETLITTAVITILNGGTNTQLSQNNIVLEPYSNYILDFYAMTLKNTQLPVSVIQDVYPYMSYGLKTIVDTTPEWQHIFLPFKTTNTEQIFDGRLMFLFSGAANPGDVYYIDNVTLIRVEDLCDGVVCDNICQGNDLWSQKCVNGECVLDQLIQQNSSTCGYDPCAGVVCDNICQGNDLWSQKCVNGACFLDLLVEQNSSTCGYDPCAGVVCDNICIGNDLWSQKCVNGACFLDQLIQQNSSTCGYDPCAGVVCDNICQGNDLWSQKCVNGACFLDQLVEQNSSTCGPDPCAGVVCDNICQGNDLWSQKCVSGECVLDQLVEQNSLTCDLGPCENVFCHNTCVGYDLWSQICDPVTGECKIDQLLQSNSATCMVTDYIPTDESTIKLYLIMGGLAFAGLGMVLLAKNK